MLRLPHATHQSGSSARQGSWSRGQRRIGHAPCLGATEPGAKFRRRFASGREKVLVRRELVEFLDMRVGLKAKDEPCSDMNRINVNKLGRMMLDKAGLSG